MGLSADTLATELKAAPEFPATEQDVIDKWSAAWQTYWEESEATPGPVAANSSPSAAVSAFETAMIGISSTSNDEVAAATIIKDACKQFWTAATPVLAYPTVPAPAPGAYVTPPPFMVSAETENAFVAALAAVFLANRVGSVGKDDSMDAIATAIDLVQGGATFLDTTTPTPITYTVG